MLHMVTLGGSGKKHVDRHPKIGEEGGREGRRDGGRREGSRNLSVSISPSVTFSLILQSPLSFTSSLPFSPQHLLF